MIEYKYKCDTLYFEPNDCKNCKCRFDKADAEHYGLSDVSKFPYYIYDLYVRYGYAFHWFYDAWLKVKNK